MMRDRTILALVAGSLMIGHVAAAGEVVESSGSFDSLGHRIGVERFAPKAAGRHPAVLILHGAGGMDVGGPEFREFARELARRGFVASIVHYFDQNGPEVRRVDERTIARSFSAWMVTVGDAIADLSRRDDVDADRVGLLGFSLGSYLALSVAGHDRRVAAVVEYFGGLPDLFARNVRRFPPTLILHGDADPTVPVAEARKLAAFLEGRKFPHELKVYPGQGHRFRGPDEADAYARALAFLDRHVKDRRPGG